MNLNLNELTHPILGVPSTSLNLNGPARFLARVVGMIGRGAIGRAWNFESGSIAPPENLKWTINSRLWEKYHGLQAKQQCNVDTEKILHGFTCWLSHITCCFDTDVVTSLSVLRRTISRVRNESSRHAFWNSPNLSIYFRRITLQKEYPEALLGVVLDLCNCASNVGLAYDIPRVCLTAWLGLWLQCTLKMCHRSLVQLKPLLLES